MKVQELFNQVELQSEIIYCYYDYENTEERIVIDKEKAKEFEIRYIYCENNKIYIEVDIEF